jgi:hypothetical protein
VPESEPLGKPRRRRYVAIDETKHRVNRVPCVYGKYAAFHFGVVKGSDFDVFAGEGEHRVDLWLLTIMAEPRSQECEFVATIESGLDNIGVVASGQFNYQKVGHAYRFSASRKPMA